MNKPAVPHHPTVLAATSLEELQKAIRALHRKLGPNAWDEYDEMALPNYGGGPLDTNDGAFSWDASRVLCGDTITDAMIVTREQFMAALD